MQEREPTSSVEIGLNDQVVHGICVYDVRKTGSLEIPRP
jgi:hypothetical protein